MKIVMLVEMYSPIGTNHRNIIRTPSHCTNWEEITDEEYDLLIAWFQTNEIHRTHILIEYPTVPTDKINKRVYDQKITIKQRCDNLRNAAVIERNRVAALERAQQEAREKAAAVKQATKEKREKAQLAKLLAKYPDHNVTEEPNLNRRAIEV